MNKDEIFKMIVQLSAIMRQIAAIQDKLLEEYSK